MRNTMRFAPFLMALCLLSLAGTAVAQGAKAMRKQIESSMLLKGDIEVTAQGTVSRVLIEREEKVPPGVAAFVRESAMKWKFEPVLRDGAAVAVRAPMSVRVVAKKRDDGDYEIAIRNASFSEYDPDDLSKVARGKKTTPPKYPTDLIRAGVGGDVYLAVKIGRDGRAESVVTEQVNLMAIGDADRMRNWRKQLAKVSEDAAKEWTYRIPTKGTAADGQNWSVIVPFSFRVHRYQGFPRKGSKESPDSYGQWEAYVPGPFEPAPWRSGGNAASPDALAYGGVYMESEVGPKLLTPLSGG